VTVSTVNSRPVLSVIQKACGADRAQNVSGMVDLVVDAIDAGADIVLPQELFQGPYFCQTEHQDWFAWACSVDEDPGVAAISKSTKGRGAVVPVSFFERAGQAHYNSVAIVEDGEVLGVYRKSHIPDGPGYEEKFYFNPGDTGFKVYGATASACICWDQWFDRADGVARRGDRSLSPAIGSGRRPVRERHRGHVAARDGPGVQPWPAANRIGTRTTSPLRVVVHRRPAAGLAGPTQAR
jgi:N-carbamoylputrescine amidase